MAITGSPQEWRQSLELPLRRGSKRYLYPSIFQGRIGRLVSRHEWSQPLSSPIRRARRKYLYQSVFQPRIVTFPRTAPILWDMSRPSRTAIPASKPWVKTKYPSFFIKPSLVADTSFTSNDWVEVPDQSTVWTEVK